jgi:ribonuclease D
MLKREERWELAQASFEFLPTIVSLDLLQFKDLFEH